MNRLAQDSARANRILGALPLADYMPLAAQFEPVQLQAVAEAPHSLGPEESIQDTSVQADTWSELLHVRMGKLTDDIHTLNDRLDRLDERSKTKV